VVGVQALGAGVVWMAGIPSSHSSSGYGHRVARAGLWAFFCGVGICVAVGWAKLVVLMLAAIAPRHKTLPADEFELKTDRQNHDGAALNGVVLYQGRQAERGARYLLLNDAHCSPTGW